MDYNIHTTLNSHTQAQVVNSLSAIERLLNFLINLSPQERKEVPSVGRRREAFVRETLEFAHQKPQILPGYRPLARFVQIQQDIEFMRPILTQVRSLLESLDDTLVIISGNSYRYGLAFYRNLQFAAMEEVPGTNIMLDRLSAYFDKNGAATQNITGDDPRQNDSGQNDSDPPANLIDLQD